VRHLSKRAAPRRQRQRPAAARALNLVRPMLTRVAGVPHALSHTVCGQDIGAGAHTLRPRGCRQHSPRSSCAQACGRSTAGHAGTGGAPVGAHARHVRPGDATARKQRVRGATPGVPSGALFAAVLVLPSIGMRAGLKKSMFWCETKGFCSFCLFAKEALLEVS
jgi:hypothetical protein